MRIAAFDNLSPNDPLETFPVTIEQTSARLPAALMLALVAALLVLVAIPFTLILASLAGEPAARALLAERPGATLQMALGVVVWMTLFAWPANRLLNRLVAARTVTLTPEHIEVRERGLLGTEVWMLPLAAYDGLAHHVRASLSGTHHELILAHADRDRSVLLAIAPRFSEADVQRISRLLCVREIPARDLYASRRSRKTESAVIGTGEMTPAVT
jgi:hypothetical protein